MEVLPENINAVLFSPKIQQVKSFIQSYRRSSMQLSPCFWSKKEQNDRN